MDTNLIVGKLLLMADIVAITMLGDIMPMIVADVIAIKLC